MILTPGEISYLATSFKTTNPLSLYTNITKAPEGNEYQKLSEKGIIINNAYEPKALDILMLLTKPERCSRLIIKNAFSIIEKYTYKIGDRLILVENNNGEFAISEPEDLTELMVTLSSFISLSKIKTTDISEALTPFELLVLLAIIDIYRKKTLVGYIEAKDQEIKLSESEIAAELAEGFSNGLAKSIINNYNITKIQPHLLNSILEQLSKTGCIVSGSNITLNPVYEIFAKNFLIPENIILYEAFELTSDGSILADSTLGITAGVFDIVSFMYDKENFQMMTLSASEMIRAIELTLMCPKFSDDAPKSAPSSAPASASASNTFTAPAAANTASMPDGSWKCSCGAVNKGNFCAQCGNRKP